MRRLDKTGTSGQDARVTPDALPTPPANAIVPSTPATDPARAARLLGTERTLPAASIEAVAPSPIPSGDYRRRIRAYVAEEEAEIAASGRSQRSDAHSFYRFHEGPASKGIAVLLHAFDSVTADWQKPFAGSTSAADDLFRLGYDIFAPALPGHGLLEKDGAPATDALPTARSSARWTEFEDRIFAAAAGAPRTTLVGLSFGASLALDLGARRRTELEADGRELRIVALSPYLELQGGLKEGLADAALFGHEVIGKPFDFLLHEAPIRLGKNNGEILFSRWIPADVILGLKLIADRTRGEAKSLRGVPIDMVVSLGDQVVDPHAALDFARAARAATDVIAEKDGIPHDLLPRTKAQERIVERVRAWLLERLAR